MDGGRHSWRSRSFRGSVEVSGTDSWCYGRARELGVLSLLMDFWWLVAAADGDLGRRLASGG